jgi:hypothetical protein
MKSIQLTVAAFLLGAGAVAGLKQRKTIDIEALKESYLDDDDDGS